MTAISSVSAPAVAQQLASAQKVSDPDHDGDNDAGKSAAAESAEGGSHGPAVKLTLSPTAQARIGG